MPWIWRHKGAKFSAKCQAKGLDPPLQRQPKLPFCCEKLKKENLPFESSPRCLVQTLGNLLHSNIDCFSVSLSEREPSPLSTLMEHAHWRGQIKFWFDPDNGNGLKLSKFSPGNHWISIPKRSHPNQLCPNVLAEGYLVNPIHHEGLESCRNCWNQAVFCQDCLVPPPSPPQSKPNAKRGEKHTIRIMEKT